MLDYFAREQQADMCDRCRAIDWQLLSYRRTFASIDDRFVLGLIAEAITDLEAERAALHPSKEADNGEIHS